MALVSVTLSNELQARMAPGAADPEGGLADAYGAYMLEATGILAVAGCAAAMKAAMTFSHGTAAAGAAVVAAGFAAFWAPMVITPATYFAGATIIVPPAFASLAASLESDFDANTSGNKSLAQSMDAIAASGHSSTVGQGTYQVGAAPPVPIV